MPLVLFGAETCFGVAKVAGAATIAGATITVKPKEEICCDFATFTRYPALCTPQGLVGGSNAGMRYIARAYRAAELYGQSLADEAEVDTILDAITGEIENYIGALEEGKMDKAAVAAAIAKGFETMDKTLAKKTFLVGERMTIADISAANMVFTAKERGVADVEGYIHLVRLANTVSALAQWRKTITPCACKVEAAKSTGGKKDVKKAETPKTVEAAAPVVKKEAPKDVYPETKFDMESWKRYYSNSKDLRGDAMKYFWDNYDAEGLSLWHTKYQRYNDQDNTKVFMASNLLGMFLQRIDNSVRRVAFAVCDVFDMGEYFDIEGVFLVRGHELPFALRDHDQFDSFTWTKIEIPAQKKMVEDYFCEEDAIDGKKIADCKVYK